MIIYGPSGIRCEARRFTGKEMQGIADTIEEGQSMSDHAMTQLLGSVWVSNLCTGPYDIAPEAKPNFYNQILKADISGLLLSLRVGSFRDGTNYKFAVRCPEAECKARVPWAVDLAKHVLPRSRGLSEAGRLYLSDHTPIVVTVPDDEWAFEFEGERVHSVQMRLMTLAAEEPMRKFLKQEVKRKQRKTRDILLADRLASQIVGVNGEAVASIATKLDFTRGLAQDDLYLLRDQIDEHECEVDALITVRCVECNWEFDAPLPFGPSFLDPTSLSRRERLFGLPGEE